MSVIVLGYHEMGCAALETILEEGVEVSAVFTHEDDPGEEIWFRSVADLARDRGIPVHFARGINDPTWGGMMAALEPEVIFSFHFRDLLGEALLRLPRHGCVNLHPSLLPAFRGRAPINWQLVAGVEVSGVTLHHMTRRADAGDIIDQTPVPVGPDDTALDLYRRLLPAAQDLLRRNLRGVLDGSAPRKAQDPSRATRFGRRTPEDGRIDWSRPAREIHNLVRAVAPPWPGAFYDVPSARVRVLRTRIPGPADPRPPLPPGEWIVLGDRAFAGTGDGPIEILESSRGPAGGASPRRSNRLPVPPSAEREP